MVDKNNDTIPIGVRIQKYLLDRAKAIDPDFNLSEFVRSALFEKYGNSIEKSIKILKEIKEDLKRN